MNALPSKIIAQDEINKVNLDIMSSTQKHTMPGTQNNFLSNIDPDINLINVNSQNHCKYYNITDFNSETAKLEDNYISILATNLRSSNKNLHQFINYINNLNTNWTFIKITEGVNRTLLPTLIYQDTVMYMTLELTKLGEGVAFT